MSSFKFIEMLDTRLAVPVDDVEWSELVEQAVGFMKSPNAGKALRLNEYLHTVPEVHAPGASRPRAG